MMTSGVEEEIVAPSFAKFKPETSGKINLVEDLLDDEPHSVHHGHVSSRSKGIGQPRPRRFV
jgi:hypothetical protein